MSDVKLTSAFPALSHGKFGQEQGEHVRSGNPARIPPRAPSDRASAPEIRDREFAIARTNERFEILTLQNSRGD